MITILLYALQDWFVHRPSKLKPQSIVRQSGAEELSERISPYGSNKNNQLGYKMMTMFFCFSYS